MELNIEFIINYRAAYCKANKACSDDNRPYGNVKSAIGSAFICGCRHLLLFIACPYDGFANRWSTVWQRQYKEILMLADFVKYICDCYSRSCFQARNEWMDGEPRRHKKHNGLCKEARCADSEYCRVTRLAPASRLLRLSLGFSVDFTDNGQPQGLTRSRFLPSKTGSHIKERRQKRPCISTDTRPFNLQRSMSRYFISPYPLL